ncbi:MAG: helix-turn-helix domain-containing protein [Erythrobacter sp.]|uniref:AraC family transcriptional regulator n=1 Tax=Erythrobacter sp. TaxID=1042 RepID=UPI0025FF83FE|nr:helix-turn-helix domain-containing protein [Erythrobacter sp.]MCL9999763.1 helix-turn-helix domain-containing protein [Erythrobacter sp.]
MIERLDIALRLIACGANLLLLVLLLAGEMRPGLKLPLAGLLVGAIGYLLNTTGGILGLPGPFPLSDFVSIFTPYFTWLFALRVFEHEPRRIALRGTPVLLAAAWLVAAFVLPHLHLGFYIIHVVGLLLVADLFRIALLERGDDLVEQRRTFRLWLPLLVAGQTGGILAYELVTGRGSAMVDNPPVSLAGAVLILAVVLFAGLTLLRTEPELLVRSEAPAAEAQGRSEFGAPPASPLSPSEMVLKEKLEAAMAEGMYRTPGLSIAGLAEHLGTPEHRLRALINQRLGYRNFSAFLNRYRITEAKAVLADRARVDLPVLTIAMDLGYNSLPPFNRAFRSQTGQTPTDYRRAAIGQN